MSEFTHEEEFIIEKLKENKGKLNYKQLQTLCQDEFEGVRHDTGTPLGWLKANISFALKRADIGSELKDYLRGLL